MSKVASLFYLVPAVTALIAWALFGEQLTPCRSPAWRSTTLGVALASSGGPARGAAQADSGRRARPGRAPRDSGLIAALSSPPRMKIAEMM